MRVPARRDQFWVHSAAVVANIIREVQGTAANCYDADELDRRVVVPDQILGSYAVIAITFGCT